MPFVYYKACLCACRISCSVCDSSTNIGFVPQSLTGGRQLTKHVTFLFSTPSEPRVNKPPVAVVSPKFEEISLPTSSTVIDGSREFSDQRTLPKRSNHLRLHA